MPRYIRAVTKQRVTAANLGSMPIRVSFQISLQIRVERFKSFKSTHIYMSIVNFFIIKPKISLKVMESSRLIAFEMSSFEDEFLTE